MGGYPEDMPSREFTDWTARLLANDKERLLISGIGSEFVCKKHRATAPAGTEG